MIDPALVRRIVELADMADKLATVQRESRTAQVLAVDLALLARAVKSQHDADVERARLAMRRPLCARCGTSPAGVEGLCVECEAVLRG